MLVKVKALDYSSHSIGGVPRTVDAIIDTESILSAKQVSSGVRGYRDVIKVVFNDSTDVMLVPMKFDEFWGVVSPMLTDGSIKVLE